MQRKKKENALGSESHAPSLQDSVCPCIGDANTLVCLVFCKLGSSCAISSGTGSKVPQSLCQKNWWTPSAGKREEAGLVEDLTNFVCVLASGHIVCRDIPLALSSSLIALLMDAIQKSCVHSCLVRLERTVDFVCVCWAGEGSAKEKTAFDSNGCGLFSFHIINYWCHELLC